MSIGTSECFTSSDHCWSALKGVVGEAGALTNKPLVHVVEVSVTWETRGPHGHNRKHHVTRLCLGYAETAADPGPSGKGTPAAHRGEGGGLSHRALHDHAQATGRVACACPAAAQGRSGRHHHRAGAGG